MNRVSFLQNAVAHIGLPPLVDMPGSSAAETLQAALQFLVPGMGTFKSKSFKASYQPHR